ncbi:hypothetical protein LTR72_003864 [Exophiala xenobiotica]|nr:hypothetical protein LTR72_003864 [Exophiala xenobiotica]KAK5298781.1 hypothetical protein LTR14_002632 [Exophiala xenobiotica]KAK5494180.1 hypothetical protein LTR55_002565 [Exophiala xenobiotica]
MDLDLLKCSICPKQPSFSDVSHLLTHVSSKGHLSHLHKLQVRSHQEFEAGIVLANYNQWYEQHGLAQLLSERMVTKQVKKAGRRKAAIDQGAYVTETGTRPRPPLDEPPLQPQRSARGRAQSQKKTTRGRRSKQTLDDDSDFEYSPVKRSRHRPRRSQVVSPIKEPPDNEDYFVAPGALLPFTTPEHSKLKGTIWPGMDLFDAATEEMKRKRNQKKDGSVVRRMQRLAALVEPTEVVYSPGGNIMKARHIDDLEDTSSVIHGESPIPKAKKHQARKRQPLVERDVNAPRRVKRKAKVSPPKKRARQALDQNIPPLPYLPSSSTGESYTIGSRFLAPEDDDEDFKPVIETGSPRKRSSHFTIFDDGSPGYGPVTPVDQRRNPFHAAPPSYLNTLRPQLPAISAPWLQPEHQAALQYTNLYTTFRPGSRDSQFLYNNDMGKENAPPMAGLQSEYRGLNTNPLSWRSPVRDGMTLAQHSESPFGGFFGLFPVGSHHDDPFVMNRNPLAEAMEHFEEQISDTDVKVAQPSLQGSMADEESKAELPTAAATN